MIFASTVRREATSSRILQHKHVSSSTVSLRCWSHPLSPSSLTAYTCVSLSFTFMLSRDSRAGVAQTHTFLSDFRFPVSQRHIHSHFHLCDIYISTGKCTSVFPFYSVSVCERVCTCITPYVSVGGVYRHRHSVTQALKVTFAV